MADIIFPQVEDVVCTVAALASATADVRIVTLAPEDGRPFPFLAGQYARVAFGGLPGRDYSIASLPGQAALEFHIRDQGGGASAYAVRQLRVGERVLVRGPMGTAVLQPDHEGPILAVAGGSGLAPMRSIVESALRRGHAAPVSLYVGARTAADLYLTDHFLDLAARYPTFRFHPVLSDEPGHARWRSGYVGDVAAADLSADGLPPGLKAYLAGPPVMVESAVDRLTSLGLSEVDIHTDAFYTRTDTRMRAAAGG